MKRLPFLMVGLLAVSFSATALAYEPKSTIADLDGRLSKIGAPRVEGVDAVGKTVGVSYIGHKK